MSLLVVGDDRFEQIFESLVASGVVFAGDLQKETFQSVEAAERMTRNGVGQTGSQHDEVMLALAILAFVTTIMWGSFNQTITNKRAIETAQERTHTVRVALMRMAREIEMGYLSASENTALSDRRTFLIGSARGDVDGEVSDLEHDGECYVLPDPAFGQAVRKFIWEAVE